MKKLNTLVSVFWAFSLSVPLTLSAASVTSDEEDNETKAPQKNEYAFPFPASTAIIKPYSTTLYVAGTNDLWNLGAKAIHSNNKEQILNIAVNPAGNLISVVTRNKKGETNLEVYSTLTQDRRVFKFPHKEYGRPTCSAFTPDARSLAVATPTGIHFFSLRKFKPEGELPAPGMGVEQMTFSPNSYYLAAAGEGKVAVFNVEEKTIRKKLNLEEQVSDVLFSPQSNEMAILTADGLLEIYDTRSFAIKSSIDDLGEGRAAAYNDNGKYIGVTVAPGKAYLINLLKPEDRQEFLFNNTPAVISGKPVVFTDIEFVPDAEGKPILAYTAESTVSAKRLHNLEPFYARLVSDETDAKMNEWLKMMPGESLEEYRDRVSEENMKKQRRLFEDEISTNLAGNLVSMASMSLGAYDRSQGMLAINFDTMPTIYLPVPEDDVVNFGDGGQLVLSDVQYGLMPDDTFEIIYAKVTNKKNGKTYVYDNVDRVPMKFLDSDNTVSIEVLQQQQMEELKLQEIKEAIVAQAKNENILSDHTRIAVNSKVVPEYDANGNKITNYVVNFNYEVEPGFSAEEDFGPAKYQIAESGAATAMLQIVKEAFEGDFAPYLAAGKKLKVDIFGTADATPVIRTIPYDGSFGEFEEEPIRLNGTLTTITVTPQTGVNDNPQLAFLRAEAVKDNLEKNIPALQGMKRDYNVNIGVSEEKGSEFRRIMVEFTFVDAF